MKITQAPIDLDVPIVAIRFETDEPIRTEQTPESRAVRTARRKRVSFIDDEPGQKSLRLKDLAQTLQHFVVSKFA